jgi:hypothetical protein
MIHLTDVINDLQYLLEKEGNKEVTWITGYQDWGGPNGTVKDLTITMVDENDKLQTHRFVYDNHARKDSVVK